jgi:hypothetical protein
VRVDRRGRPIPMLLNRLDKQGVRDHPGLAELPSVTARKFYYDTVCFGSKATAVRLPSLTAGDQRHREIGGGIVGNGSER